MYRISKQKAVKRIGLSAVLALGVTGMGVGVASASPHSHGKHSHASFSGDSGLWSNPSDWGWQSGHDDWQGSEFAVHGTITAVSGSSITVLNHDGVSTTLSLNSSTTVLQGSSAATLATLAVGQKVLILPSNTDASVAARVFIAVPFTASADDDQEATHVEGSVTAVTPTSVTVLGKDGTSTTFTLASTTTYSMDRSPATLANLVVGEKVCIESSSSAPGTATSVKIELAHVAGKVTAISGDTIMVATRDGGTATVMASSTTTFTMSGAATTLASITVGSLICAEGTLSAGSTTILNAASIGIHAVSADDDSHSSTQGDDDQFSQGDNHQGDNWQGQGGAQGQFDAQSQFNGQGGDGSASWSGSGSFGWGH